jgi:hypothetical protein
MEIWDVQYRLYYGFRSFSKIRRIRNLKMTNKFDIGWESYTFMKLSKYNFGYLQKYNSPKYAGMGIQWGVTYKERGCSKFFLKTIPLFHL